MLLLIAAAFAAEPSSAPTNATVLVTIVDEKGEPVSLSWREGYELGSRSSEDRKEWSCRITGYEDNGHDSYGYRPKWCVPLELTTLTAIDGQKVAESRSVPGTFLLPEKDVTWFHFRAMPGERQVVFPSVLRTPQETYSVVRAENAWTFADGRLYTLVVRPASELVVSPLASTGQGSYVLVRDDKDLTLTNQVIEPGAYTLAWRPAPPPRTSALCPVVADATVPKGLPDKALLGDLSMEEAICATGRVMSVTVKDGVLVRTKTDLPKVDAPPPAGVVVVANGKEVAVGAVITVKPGEDLALEVRTPLASGR